ncbi:MAG: prepilin-type N-terminal cleavage/methylation domain-containing protein [Gammaproteobacteria bacterium]
MRATSVTGSACWRLRSWESFPGRGGGFTLIELMVVIAVLVLMTSVLPLALNRALPGRRVAVTAQRIASAVREAQSQSTATGNPVRLQFRQGVGLALADRLAVSFAASTTVTLIDSDGRKGKRLTAYPDGSITSARFEVSESTHRSDVVVSGVTGKVAVSSGPT